jgi:hypothetical protein
MALAARQSRGSCDFDLFLPPVCARSSGRSADSSGEVCYNDPDVLTEF